jgi:hypothetical protein
MMNKILLKIFQWFGANLEVEEEFLPYLENYVFLWHSWSDSELDGVKFFLEGENWWHNHSVIRETISFWKHKVANPKNKCLQLLIKFLYFILCFIWLF